MKFVKIFVVVIGLSHFSLVFGQIDFPFKSIDQLIDRNLELAESNSRISSYDFITDISGFVGDKPLHDSKVLSELNVIQNEIALAVRNKSAPYIFEKKTNDIISENEKIKNDLKEKKINYYKILSSISGLEKEFGFFYEKQILIPMPSYSNIYLVLIIIISFLFLVFLVKVKVISFRRWWRSREPERTILFRWIGLSFLFSIFICSCQREMTVGYERYDFSKAIELENLALEDKFKVSKNRISDKEMMFKNKLQDHKEIEPLLLKCFSYFEVFKFRDYLRFEINKCDAEVIKIQSDIESLKSESIKSRQNILKNEQFFLGGLLILLVFSGLFFFWVFSDLKKCSNLCPRCFESDTLVQAPEDKNQLMCTSVFCKENNFRLPKRFKSFPKISFPMLGVGSAGKTHWLLNLYSLNRKSSSSSKKLSALFSMDVLNNPEFNKREQSLVQQTSGGASVQPVLSFTAPPLIFSLNDNQNLPLGLPYLFRSDGLSFCFDYAGELRQERYKETQDLVSRSNGIVFFLDVMNVDKKQIDFTNWKNNKLNENIQLNNYNIQDQTDVVGSTYSDFVIKRGLTEPNPLDLPVAVCLSKIDLLPFQGPLKGAYGDKFLQQLESCKHPPNRWSLSTIMNRSDIIRNYLPLIFAHKGIIQIFDQKFGSNYMFFPLANRGLDSNLSYGDPFGVMEPLLWLQHMHGFNVLDA